MSTREIPRDEWASFFDAFSRQHEGWLAGLEIFAAELGAQEEAHELPFEGITLAAAASDGSEEGPRGVTVTINLGKTPEDHVSHTILEPTHIWLEQTAEGANAALEIESTDETKTLLRFRHAMRPDMVDGVC